MFYTSITKDELNRMVDNHELWLSTDGKEGKQADFSWYWLDGRSIGCYITDRNLCKAIFDNCMISDVIFTDTCFNAGALSGSALKNTNRFIRCKTPNDRLHTIHTLTSKPLNVRL